MTMNPTEKGSELALPTQGATAARFREATDAASVCKEIVLKTAVTIGARRFVPVEGWMSIAICHGCVGSIKSVDEVSGGVRAVAELKRGDQVLTTAEGFVGKDEPTWYGGLMMRWDKIKHQQVEVTMPKRADYAIRAMAQTRALSRVCRTAFAHVVVLMHEGLETTPAEESVIDMPEGAVTEHPGDGKPGEGKAGEPGKEPQPIGGLAKAAAAAATGGAAPVGEKSEEQLARERAEAKAAIPPKVEVPRDEILKLKEQFRGNKWESVKIHFGTKKDQTLGALASENKINWWLNEWQPKPYGKNQTLSQDDLLLRAALDVASEELASNQS